MSHYFPPKDGRLHFNEDETIWVVGDENQSTMDP